MKNIIWIDDDPDSFIHYVNFIQEKGLRVEIFESLLKAERRILKSSIDPVDLIILDVMIPTHGEDQEAYPDYVTEHGHSTGLVFIQRMKEYIVVRKIGVLIFTLRFDSQIIDLFLKEDIPNLSLVTKTDINGVSDFLHLLENIMSEQEENAMEQQTTQSKGKIEIKNSVIGMLNTGEVEDVNKISINLKYLTEKGNDEVAESIKRITEAVTKSSELSEQLRSDVLDQLKMISEQAALTNNRANPGVIKAVLTAIGATLSAAGSLAEVWSTWGPNLRAFFSI